MAGWISSKLKVAENLLQQIDQQAAESLGKGESKLSEELNFEVPVKPSGPVSLKDQLKKKTTTRENVDLIHKPLGDRHSVDNGGRSTSSIVRDEDRGKGISDSNTRSALTDSDWTELLSTPKKLTQSRSNRANGQSGGGRGVRREVVSPGSNSKGVAQNVGLAMSSSGVGGGAGMGAEVDEVLGDGRRGNEKEDSAPRYSSVGSDDKPIEGWDFGQEPVDEEAQLEVEFGKEWVPDALGKGTESNSENAAVSGVSRSTDGNLQMHKEPTMGTDGTVSSRGNEVNNTNERNNKSIGRQGEPNAPIGLVSGDLKRGSYLRNDEGSDSGSESGSTSDSEIEREREERRKRRQQILAAKAAAKAAEAIKERENLVARLEGEKQSLEKILEERAKQAAQEASELQSMMIEMMEAVDLEKQKHNNTRMEALARLAKLETVNADLARSLASAQWNLEVEVNRVAELRKKVEIRGNAHEELRRKIASTQQTSTYLGNSVGSKGAKLENEMLVAEYSFVTDKIKRLKEKETKLKEMIESTQKEMQNPTEVEIEIKRRLAQMSDRLIQKQSQVEALSSEKAMLLFRIEAVSTLLDENKYPTTTAEYSGSSQDDVETGTWELSSSRGVKPMLEGKLQSGKQHLGSLARQLDAIFAAGAVVLRRKPQVKLLSIVYLSCLHFWVLYILFSHSPSSSAEAKSGAVFSLENINTTSGG